MRDGCVSDGEGERSRKFTHFLYGTKGLQIEPLGDEFEDQRRGHGKCGPCQQHPGRASTASAGILAMSRAREFFGACSPSSHVFLPEAEYTEKIGA